MENETNILEILVNSLWDFGIYCYNKITHKEIPKFVNYELKENKRVGNSYSFLVRNLYQL